jgi:ketosteroid isomerase-like protein
MQDEDTILALLRQREDAIARGDAEGVIAPLSDDVVLFDLLPPLLYRGPEAKDAEGLRAWFGTWENGVEARLHHPTVMVEADMAVVHGLQRMQGVKRGEGPLDQWMRMTVVLRRSGGSWRIVHEHLSFPLKMDGSGLAATDLKPD